VKVIDQVRDVVTGRRVFGEAFEKNGVTVIPAASVRGGGGGAETPTKRVAAGLVWMPARSARSSSRVRMCAGFRRWT